MYTQLLTTFDIIHETTTSTKLTALEENQKQLHEAEMPTMIMDIGIRQWKIPLHYSRHDHLHNREIHPSIPQAIASWMHPQIMPVL